MSRWHVTVLSTGEPPDISGVTYIIEAETARDAAFDVATKKLSVFTLRLGVKLRVDAIVEQPEAIFTARYSNPDAAPLLEGGDLGHVVVVEAPHRLRR